VHFWLFAFAPISKARNNFGSRFLFAVEQKSSQDVEEEGKILSEILEIVEQRNGLTNQLEEDRQRCDWLLVFVGVLCLYLAVRYWTHQALMSLMDAALSTD